LFVTIGSQFNGTVVLPETVSVIGEITDGMVMLRSAKGMTRSMHVFRHRAV